MAKKPTPKKKAAPLPTGAKMKTFAKKFKKGEWETCAESATFRKAVETDLKKAEIYAVKILGNLWDWQNDSPYDT